MSNLFEIYKQVYLKINELNKELLYAKYLLKDAKKDHLTKINILREDEDRSLKQNSENITKVNAFISIAKNNINVFKEALFVNEYDNLKLSKLAVQINSLTFNDPAAIELYTQATAQLNYLQRLESFCRSDFDKKIQIEEECFFASNKSTIEKIQNIEKEISEYINSDKVLGFAKLIKLTNDIYASNATYNFTNNEMDKNISLGIVELAFPIDENILILQTNPILKFLDRVKKNIAIPITISIDTGIVILADYNNNTELNLLSGIQNFIINIAKYYDKNYKRITFIDPLRFNASSLGALAKVIGRQDDFIDEVPKSFEEIRNKLNIIIKNITQEEIISSNLSEQQEKKELYIFHNFPQGYDLSMIAQIQQLCANAEYYNLTIVLTYNKSSKSISNVEAFEFIKNMAVHISEGSYYDKNIGFETSFKWYQAPLELSENILNKFGNKKSVVDLSNNYERRVGFSETINYKKGIRKLEDIPFGIDENGVLQYLDFENSNFATFICGAARSGKSTLLHTLVSGLIKQNHPDDIELWLIDFKMTEFSRYIKHLPPHIRYIILDESVELVYDIIDRLTEILIKRQNIFKGNWQKLDDVPVERYMPSIMVIIDEFSVMSEIVSESIMASRENYVIKLQMLLAKGSALGIHFIFASQGFTTGTRGLNDFSKKQVQQRIAMKTEYNEIKETLDLKTTSDEDKAIMEQLPVHHAVLRIPTDERGSRLKLSQVLHISDYSQQEKMIELINKTLYPVTKFDENNNNSYISKQPMIFDGNNYVAFSEKREEMQRYLHSNYKVNYEDKLSMLFVGEPRRMVSIYPVIVANEICENILMISPYNETATATSIILSMINSLEMQSSKIEVWSNKKNSIYRILKYDCTENISFENELEVICNQIKSIKNNIKLNIESNEFFILLGFESILTEMSFNKSNETSDSYFRGRKPNELDLLSQLELLNNKSQNNDEFKVNSENVVDNENGYKREMKIYDAREDLKYIFTHGPKLGYHFVMSFNSASEIKQSRVDSTLFKHKLIFRASRNDVADILGAANAKVVSELQEHSFRYCNGLDELSFRPYLHKGVSWDGWTIGENGIENVVEDEYLL